MLGSSNQFGQPSSSPLRAQSAFGQKNTAYANISMAPKTIGSTSPFGSQTGGSLFGSTTSGVFTATQSPSSTPAFGTSSRPAFGTSSVPVFGPTSTTTFGASSTSAFGSTSTTFGTTSAFGQKSAFAGFGSQNKTQLSPFGQQQPNFGSQPFGVNSSPAFGTTSTLAFGVSNTPAFGASITTPSFGFGSTSASGQSCPSFGSGYGLAIEERKFWMDRAELLDVELFKERVDRLRLQGQVGALQRERETLLQEKEKARDQLQAQLARLIQMGEEMRFTMKRVEERLLAKA